LNKLQDYFNRTLPAAFSQTVTGRAKDFRESFYYLSIALIFSIVFVYLVLAAQFESFLQPFVILLTLPLAGVGAFAALWAMGMTLNIFSFIGLIMLVGMATKNAILMVDYANQLYRQGGREIIEAAREAAHIRFRPVVMTTLSTVLGIMPIALGFGAGGEARAPLGVVVTAGLLVTTLLTLVVIPVVFSVVQQGKEKVANAMKKPS
jgi:multidrug efflux pump subunit AcrB